MHPIDDHLLGIGELSRTSGLSVSALRFYDREGVLAPAEVDPLTGYRRYSPGQVPRARLLAGMRRVGMPLAEMHAVLDSLPDTAVADDLLAGHLHRLEVGLVDARREITRLRTSLLPSGPVSAARSTVDAPALAEAIDGVRYAVGSDPEFPALGAVLFEQDGDGLRMVATDRYRLAVAEVVGAGSVGAGRALVPVAVVDELRERLGEGPVELELDAEEFTAHLSDGVVRAAALDHEFPDYRRLLHDPAVVGPDPGVAARSVPVAVVLAALAGQDDPPDRVALDETGVLAATAYGIVLDRGFLWDAVRTVGDGQLVLPADGVIAPLVIGSTDERLLGLLMPVRPELAP